MSKRKKTITLPRIIVERVLRVCVWDVIDDWKHHGIIDSQSRKLVAVLDRSLGNPVRVWPDEGGPDEPVFYDGEDDLTPENYCPRPA